MPIAAAPRFCLPGALFVAAVAALVPAQRAAAQTSEPTVIYACYVPSTGTVYRIKAPGLPDSCGSSRVGGKVQPHVPFQWNEEGVTGPKGDPGEAGPAGPQGEVGPQGPGGTGGVSKLQMWAKPTFIDVGETVVDVNCPTGHKALSGGYRVPGVSSPTIPEVQVRSSYAIPQVYTGWRVIFFKSLEYTGTPKSEVAAYAMCADIGS